MSEARFPCPECQAELGFSGATRCTACGWTARKRGKENDFHIAESCEYVTAMQERCQYPPTWSPSTNGSGPWFCRFHALDRHSSMADHMVEASKDFDPRALKKPEPTAEELEQGAREVAIKFGVDPNLSPKDRCIAVLKAWELAKKQNAVKQAA